MPRKSTKSDLANASPEVSAPAPVKRAKTEAKAPAKPRARKLKAADPVAAIALEPTTEHVAEEAYLLWLADGKPQGRDLEHWLLAEQIVRSRLSLLSAAVHSA